MAKDPETIKSKHGIKEYTDEENKKIYDIFLKEYLGTDDNKLIEKAHKQIQGIACCRLLFPEIGMPGAFLKQSLDMFKELTLSYYDSGLEPLCF